MKELHKFTGSPDLTAAQKTLFTENRQPEELYDVVNDPYEIHNLAGNPEYKNELLKMRKRLRTEMLKNDDTGLMPEPEMMRLSENSTPYEITKNQELFPVSEILDACDLMVDPHVSPDHVIQKLNDDNGFVRYWAVVSAESSEMYNSEILSELKERVKSDNFVTVQIEAAKTLIKAGEPEYVQVSDKKHGK